MSSLYSLYSSPHSCSYSHSLFLCFSHTHAFLVESFRSLSYFFSLTLSSLFLELCLSSLASCGISLPPLSASVCLTSQQLQCKIQGLFDSAHHSVTKTARQMSTRGGGAGASRSPKGLCYTYVTVTCKVDELLGLFDWQSVGKVGFRLKHF